MREGWKMISGAHGRAKRARTATQAKWKSAQRNWKLLRGVRGVGGASASAPRPDAMQRDASSSLSEAAVTDRDAGSSTEAAAVVTALKRNTSIMEVYRQIIEAEKAQERATVLEKHRKAFVAGDSKTDPAAKMRERHFDYASLNEHLVMLSLTRAVRTPRSSHNPSHNY